MGGYVGVVYQRNKGRDRRKDIWHINTSRTLHTHAVFFFFKNYSYNILKKIDSRNVLEIMN